MSKRLGGGGVTIPHQKPLDRIHKYQLASMSEAVERYRIGYRLRPCDRNKQDRWLDEPTLASIIHTPEGRMDSLLAQAETLIDEAILIDPRLTKRAAWRLAEDGIDACPAMVAAGEERCYLDRRKLRLADQATLEPVRIVISTDTKHVEAKHAVAFIAAAKLAQQFRPLEIWWQGAWLIEENPNRRADSFNTAGCGHIIHVPLIQGDMDFSRLVFILSSEFRDHVSFRIMFGYAYPASLGWGGGVGPQSYLDNTFAYISEKGIGADAWNVAHYAAKWAGMDSLWKEEVSDSSAEQTWVQPVPYKSPTWTSEDEARYVRQDRERKELAAKEANERLNHT